MLTSVHMVFCHLPQLLLHAHHLQTFIMTVLVFRCKNLFFFLIWSNLSPANSVEACLIKNKLHRHLTSFFIHYPEGKLNFNLTILFKALRKFPFQISSRKEKMLYRLDLGWPKYSEYFTGTTFCVAVDSLHGLVYVAQVSKIGF
jgi:hypothetical protein